MARGNGPSLAQRLPLLMLKLLLILTNATSRAKSFWGKRKKAKRSPRRAKAQTEKPSAEQSRPHAPCKRPTPHGNPELIPPPSSAPSPWKGRGMKEPAPTLETCASAKAPSREDPWQLPDMDSVGTLSSSASVSSGSSHYIDTPEGRIRMPKVCSLGSPSSRGSVSSGSSHYIDTLEGRIRMPKVCSLGAPLSSSSRCRDTLPERGLAATSGPVAQKRSGPAQSPDDGQGLVATAGGNETFPKERPQPPTCREVEAKLRQPGGRMWLYGQRVELPLLDTHKAADGDQTRRNNVAPDRSARLWQCLKACWKCCLESCCCCFPKTPG